MTPKFYIDDQVRIGRFEHLGPLAGVTGKIVSIVKPLDGDTSYQACNIRREDNGERLSCIDSRVLTREQA